MPQTAPLLQPATGSAEKADAEKDLFHWPIVTAEDEAAVLDVLRRGSMSGWSLTKEFESDMAEWFGTRYALGACNGTASLQAAMFGCEIGAGDEVICPGFTYWASFLPLLSLRAVPVFADIDPKTFCLDPEDVAKRITPRTKALILVHQFGHPCQMDAFVKLKEAHGIKIIEDVSHAQGGKYKGRLLGTIGDVGAMSLMAGKSLAVGEAGMLITNDERIHQRAMAFGHYERAGLITDPELKPFAGMPLGGCKHRMNQTCAAMGRVQLRHYRERITEIQQAMNYFWDGLEGVPGVRPHRVDASDGSSMGGWYSPMGHYLPEEVGGKPAAAFAEDVKKAGSQCSTCPGNYFSAHLHPLLQSGDVYGEGAPTVQAHAKVDQRLQKGALPVTEGIRERIIGVPWFKKFRPQAIDRHIAAFRKALEG